MDKKIAKDDRASPELLKLLNEALRLEYTLIIHYPRLASGIKDAETRKLAQQLGTESVQHADVVADTIAQLGGKPDWSFAPFPDHYEPLQVFQIQLQKERQALELHSKAAGLLPPGPMADAVKSLADEEHDHISIVEKIISNLTQQ
ncbi:ferritin-like domain-containing protein [bacterium]|nr:ferritin-like domain-containing protein [bacterium]